MYTHKDQEESIAVIIPAFNVEKYVDTVINQLPTFIDFIIVVDDCSQDTTTQEVEKIKDKRIHLIRHEKNQGVGGAMLSGYNLAFELGANIMVKVDGDDQMDPTYIESLINPIVELKADYTKGNRFLHIKELQKMPVVRRIGNLGLSFLTKLSSGYWNIFDPTNGYTAIHRDVYELLDKEAIDKDYFFETSMLIQLNKIKALVLDIPIPAKYDDQLSNISLMSTLFKFPWKLLRGLFKRIGYQYFLFDFTATSVYLLMGAPALLFGITWGIIQWVHSIKTGIIATSGTVLIAVLPIIIGIQLIIQAISLDINDVPKTSIRIND